MNKDGLVDYVYRNSCLEKGQAREAIDTALRGLTETLSKGEEVRLHDFGVFSVKVTPEHEGRNPRTGETITIPERSAPKFSPAKALKVSMNGGAE